MPVCRQLSRPQKLTDELLLSCCALRHACPIPASQQQLQPNTAAALRVAVPELEDEDLEAMMRAPMRSFEPNIVQVRCAHVSVQCRPA